RALSRIELSLLRVGSSRSSSVPHYRRAQGDSNLSQNCLSSMVMQGKVKGQTPLFAFFGSNRTAFRSISDRVSAHSGHRFGDFGQPWTGGGALPLKRRGIAG